MNYLERLIRRALLDAPLRAGDPLRDPFENEAAMAFDTPAQPPAAPWPMRVPPPSAARVTVAPQAADDIAMPRAAALPPAASAEHWGETASVASAADAPSVSTPLAPPASPAASPAAIAPAPLSQADAFMRGIGVAVPDTSAPAPRIAPDAPTLLAAPSAVAPDAVRTEAASLPRRVETLQPPPPRLPTPSSPPRAAAEPDALRSATTTPSSAVRGRAPAAPPRAVPAPVRETVHILRVADPETARGAQQGASPPAFGAGQL